MKAVHKVHPDQKYIRALAQNDRALIAEIYDKYAPSIAAMVRRNQGTDQDAKDIFQEALLTIFRQAVDKDLQLSCSFQSYLWVICYRKWLNRLKRDRKIQVTSELPEGYNAEPDALTLAEQTLLEEERQALFWSELQKLSPRCRQIWRMVLQGYTNPEIAEALQLDPNYVRTEKSECKARLRRRIKSSPQFAQLKYR